MLDLTLIFVQNLSPLEKLHDTAEGVDFHKFDRHSSRNNP